MSATPRSRRGTWLVFELGLVVGLLVVWLTSESIRASTHLVVLFLYSFPSEFLVALVPHEPVLVHYGTVHPAWLVAVVAATSTVMAEAINYSIFGYFYERPSLRAVGDRPSVRWVIQLFGRHPFTAIVVAGFSPVPFFPIRFLVVMSGYPLARYLAGVALSRTPRFYILAAIGNFFAVPGSLLVGLLVVMLVTVNVPALIMLFRGGGSASTPPDSVSEAGPEETKTGAAPRGERRP